MSSPPLPPDQPSADVISADVRSPDVGTADSSALSASPSAAAPAPASPSVGTVRHRTERDALGRVWRFVFDPAAQDSLVPAGMVRIRCTTGTGRAMLIVRDDWFDWPRQQLLTELAAALQLQRGGTTTPVAAADPVASGDQRIARRRLVRLPSGVAWNCVYDPSQATQEGDGGHVRVRCTAGRDRLELLLDPAWHRLGDKQLATIITEALAGRRR